MAPKSIKPIEPVSLSKLGLYIHIPFCRRICHYCDFAKTARFDDGLVGRYFETIKQQILAAKTWFGRDYPELTSVYFGGGTPGMFVEPYGPIMDSLREWCSANCEITIECNPEEISTKDLTSWRAMGMNRISLGVQSFDSLGLKYLTREHTPYQAELATQMSMEIFANTNVDLIYGWQNQTADSWQTDLEKVSKLGVPHVSLYSLTYEGNTVFARRNRMGLIQSMEESLEEHLYVRACEYFANRSDWIHEEVSNFAKAGFEAVHNHLYWTNQSYLGLGVGAHGYFKDLHAPLGVRYQVPNKINAFIQNPNHATVTDFGGMVGFLGGSIEARTKDDAVMERIWTSLRLPDGVYLDDIMDDFDLSWQPTPAILKGLSQGLIELTDNHCLRLKQSQWFRESAWALEVSQSFRQHKSLI